MKLHEREQGVRSEVREIDLSEPYPEDKLHEIADSWCPVYTSEIMEAAVDDNNLATDEPEIGPAFDGSATPVNIIAGNIYERLYQAASEELQRLQEEAA